MASSHLRVILPPLVVWTFGILRFSVLLLPDRPSISIVLLRQEICQGSWKHHTSFIYLHDYTQLERLAWRSENMNLSHALLHQVGPSKMGQNAHYTWRFMNIWKAMVGVRYIIIHSRLALEICAIQNTGAWKIQVRRIPQSCAWWKWILKVPIPHAPWLQHSGPIILRIFYVQ